ncbi:MAG: SUMF1/EgtB/PvdO family nonheme iron enzyme [Acidobacteria bacterium]|nr:SUMF1/EgtB/PvdO family nonheme iron enzyme [Acidobacteriota bacterium]
MASLDLIRELARARGEADQLFALVPDEAKYDRPIPERHRIVFYIGHLEAFDWNLFHGGQPVSEPDRLFAYGIDPEAGGAASDTPGDWPRLRAVNRYAGDTRAAVDRLAPEMPAQLLHVAIEHRLRHVETLAYMLHAQPADRKLAPEASAASLAEAPALEFVEVPAGPARLGCERGFGWDNEFSAHPVEVPAFRIGRYKVTNGDYLRFLRDGGPVPHFWREAPGGWCYVGMSGEIPLAPDWPVYVTYDQASAYAGWKGFALATEAEYHRALDSCSIPAEIGNADFRRWDPVSVRAGPVNGRGISQLAGNGWEWTSTPFAPFQGFEPFAFYPGFSSAFFDGEHFVMKGASPRTARKLMRPSFRNWLRRDYPYAYATFRLLER